MPKLQLTDRTVRNLSTERVQETFWDDALPGFGVRVSGDSGRKTWTLRYRVNGRRRRLTLGTYPAVGLAQARKDAKAALYDVATGGDPGGEKRVRRKAETFNDLAKLYLERHAAKHKKASSVREDRRQLEKDLLPAWGPQKAAEIERADVYDVLDAIMDRGSPVMANRTRALASKVFNFGIARGLVDHNPVQNVARPARERSRQRVLSEDEIRALWTAFGEEHPVVGASFKLRLLTAQRGIEVLSMRHEHLDGDWWTIPPEIAKNGRAHRVPLSPEALDVLALIASWSDDSPWIFPSRRTGHLRVVNPAARRIRDRSGVEWVPHDLRRTAATFMTRELGVSRLVVSKILNHADSSVTAVYDRSEYEAEKREALDGWGSLIREVVSEDQQRIPVELVLTCDAIDRLARRLEHPRG